MLRLVHAVIALTLLATPLFLFGDRARARAFAKPFGQEDGYGRLTGELNASPSGWPDRAGP
jgi:hypothetical protein